MTLKYTHFSELPSLSIKQNRSKKTYNCLIEAGFKLIKERDFDSITVAELSKVAGYSVGAFYTRFTSKDELFDVMVIHHLKSRISSHDKIFTSFRSACFIDELIKDIVQYYWTNRKFWRTALVRGMHDPAFWAPISQSGHNLAAKVIERLSELATRSLTDMEKTNVRFAFQITLGTINNTILNQPGPIYMEQKLFAEKLTRAFRLVSNYDFITCMN